MLFLQHAFGYALIVPEQRVVHVEDIGIEAQFLITLCVIERSTWLTPVGVVTARPAALARSGSQVGGEGVAKFLAQVPLECGLA